MTRWFTNGTVCATTKALTVLAVDASVVVWTVAHVDAVHVVLARAAVLARVAEARSGFYNIAGFDVRNSPTQHLSRSLTVTTVSGFCTITMIIVFNITDICAPKSGAIDPSL